MFCNALLMGYIDPMSGAILIQVVIGGAVGLFAFFHRWIWRTGRFMFGKKQTAEHAEAEEPSSVEG